ncbi:MAG: hypothetical protein Aurels2KO_35150 [Aureliella sp.]
MSAGEHEGDADALDESVVAAVTPEEKLSKLPQDFSDKSVLVLEDDPVQARLLSKHLESLRMRVKIVETIADARSSLKLEVPHLGIFDVRLPDGSGLDLCEELDDNPEFSDLPVIVLSSMNSTDMVRRSRASGARFFLGKPYDPNILLILIEQLVGE